MFMIIIALLTLICSAAIMTGSLINTLISGSNKIYLSYSLLFIIYIINTNVIDIAIFQKIQESIAANVVTSLFSASNHFVLSLDIISLFSTFLLLFYRKLKITESLPVIQSVQLLKYIRHSNTLDSYKQGILGMRSSSALAYYAIYREDFYVLEVCKD